MNVQCKPAVPIGVRSMTSPFITRRARSIGMNLQSGGTVLQPIVCPRRLWGGRGQRLSRSTNRIA